ncbi:MAG: sugar transferase [Candidatus Kapaibacteriota bacterium]
MSTHSTSSGLSRLAKPRILQISADTIAVVGGFALYQWLRVVLLGEVRTFSVSEHMVVTAVVTTYWYIWFWLGGLYRDMYVRSPFEEFFRVVRQTFVGSAVFFLLIYMSSNEAYQENPRAVFALYWILITVLVGSGRLIARAIQRWLRESSWVRIPAVVVGSPERIRDLLAELRRMPALGYHVVGVIPIGTSTETSNTEEWFGSVPVLGPVEELSAILQRHEPKDVLISVEHSNHAELLALVARCAERSRRVKIVPDMYEIVSGQVRVYQLYGAPLIDVYPELMQPWEAVAKRTLDILVSLAILVIGSPVWLLTALVVKVSSTGPIFFRQERVGRDGSVFVMAKFRSMYTHMEHDRSWVRDGDPRVTPVGKFLRKSHLDEIPQLWNVLRGDMSLVGPRPEQPLYVEKFTAMLPYYGRRHSVRPGVTGWWQVMARSNPESKEEIESRLRYDFFYIENMSFKLDLEILVRTVFVMFQGHGRA